MFKLQNCCLQVPCVSTLCVVNLTATEAKVEVLASEFVQLRPDPSQGGLGADDPQDDYFMYDDDDNYQYEVGLPLLATPGSIDTLFGDLKGCLCLRP